MTQYSVPAGSGESSGGSGTVSCVSTSFCVEFDLGGWMHTFDGPTWTTVDNRLSPNGGYDVSCATPQFCGAVDGWGNAYLFDGTTWSAPSVIGDPAAGPWLLTCPSLGRCVAVGKKGQVWFLTNGIWSAPNRTATTDPIGFPSCPSAQFCIAVDQVGKGVVTFKPSW